MKYVLFLSVFFICLSCGTAKKRFLKESVAHQASENKDFLNSESTILTAEDFKSFKGLEFYPIDLAYCIEADFVRTPDEVPFLMRTTTDRLPEYVKYGEAHFTLQGKQLKLNLFQSTAPYDEPGYEDYLFLPFTDLTSGDGSYGGGRFLDARIPKGDKIILNFNKAYNPYCAYNSRYSCPIPPKENDLLVRIEAGVKDFGDHH
ncbi:DUF1684 domain-containing protein [Ulvibacter litoralis]|uniref:DUF1684 domain-containing protein n=1 Tax=Ulvibacter litoralis TaxID=227084 RepID=A0A1G7GQA3_9FLAO|nr:DUF1684 domain-containing protein [Ulvibacter litoralis]GHC55458.1 hypothetical protein GCM10008083_19510 [Ulvibacter litoralis]SDE90271.1 hypothetical protein SAMN05421855_103272 [Ulvibacter litoralis]